MFQHQIKPDTTIDNRLEDLAVANYDSFNENLEDTAGCRVE